MAKIWFITGTSKGFGRVWAEAALARGDRVVATARDVRALAPLVDRYGDAIAAIGHDAAELRQRGEGRDRHQGRCACSSASDGYHIARLNQDGTGLAVDR